MLPQNKSKKNVSKPQALKETPTSVFCELISRWHQGTQFKLLLGIEPISSIFWGIHVHFRAGSARGNFARRVRSAVLSSAQANSAEESHSLKESPPNQASAGLSDRERGVPKRGGELMGFQNWSFERGAARGPLVIWSVSFPHYGEKGMVYFSICCKGSMTTGHIFPEA